MRLVRRKRGFTLLELMVVVSMMAILLLATSGLVLTAFRQTERASASRVIFDRESRFEDQLRALIQAAYLSTNPADTGSYLIGGDAQSDLFQSDGSTLTFTALSDKIPVDLINSPDDFQTLNEQYGPHGAMVEVSLSLTAVGAAPASGGLFYRYQIPPDGDPSQGGFETTLDPDLNSISFEFYDGTQWLTGWDTQSLSTPRLPSAIRVTYRRQDEDQDRILTIRLIHSDVTFDQPVEVGGGIEGE